MMITWFMLQLQNFIYKSLFVVQFHAMDTLHQCEYDLGKAMCALVPPTGPILCRDQMEEWSASEANLFEEAMGNFNIEFAGRTCFS